MGKVQVDTDIPQIVNYVATSVTIGTTTILEPNTPATVTNSGTEQNAVLNFGIPSTTADFSGYRTAAAQDIIDATKQPKTLSTAITVNGVSKTTVEDALNAINENSSLADTDLSNLSATGENHFVQLQSGVSQEDVDYVIESYSSGTSWYKVWKSGWCEQGGIAHSDSLSNITVNLLLSFADTNYTLVCQQERTTTSADNHPNIYSKSVDSFVIYADSDTNNNWYACGYKAS